MKQKMTRFLNHENLENQLILLRKNHMISSNLPTKIREEPIYKINIQKMEFRCQGLSSLTAHQAAYATTRVAILGVKLPGNIANIYIINNLT